MKRLFALILTVVCAFGFAACKPKVLEKPDDDFEVNLDLDRNITETLTLMIPANDGGAEEKYINALIPGFKELFPNVTIKLDMRPISDSTYVESVNNAIASRQVPDLFWTNTGFYYYLISKNCIINLEPYYEASEKAGVFSIAGDFYKSFFDMSAYENKRYVVPRSSDSVVTYYNKELLEAANIDLKRIHNGWTWDEMIEVCEDVSDFIKGDGSKDYGDCYALNAEFTWEAVFNSTMLSYGVKVFNDDGTVAIGSDETKAMGEMIRSVRDKGRILSDSEARSTFNNGKIAFIFSSKGPAEMSEEAAITGKFDTVTFPLMNAKGTPKIGCGFVGYGISSASTQQKRDLAWQFLNYMISQKGQMAMINGGLSTPSIRVDLAEEKAWASDYKNLNLDAWLYGDEYKTASNFYITQDPSKTFDILTALQTLMGNLADYHCNKSVDKCVTDCVEELNQIIS